MTAPVTIVSGGTGYVGRFIVERLLAEGHAVTVTGRTRPPDGFFSEPVGFIADHLDPNEDHVATFDGADFFVHCAFDHLPGRFRGGEGDDPQGFRRRNIDATLARFRDAKRADVRRVAFLSSRAVYGEQPRGVMVDETTTPHPNWLYGEVKLACERGLAELSDASFEGVSLRVTGVYGPPPPGRAHKWAGVVADQLAGRPVISRLGTEVHGDDVAWAVLIALTARLEDPHTVLCVSDIVLDNADLMTLVNEEAGVSHPVPARCNPADQNEMDCARLKALGWRPGGWPLLEASVRELVAELT